MERGVFECDFDVKTVVADSLRVGEDIDEIVLLIISEQW